MGTGKHLDKSDDDPLTQVWPAETGDGGKDGAVKSYFCKNPGGN